MSILVDTNLLLRMAQLVGKNAHDARLVAAMLVHKIAKILSFNHQDFQRYQEITALAPDEVAKASTP